MHKKIPVVFVSAPFRGANSWEIEQSVRKAEELAFKVHELGGFAICIHSNCRYFCGTLNDEYWIDGCLEVLGRCNSLIHTDDWQNSSGAKREHAHAEELGKPILYNIEEFKAWMISSGFSVK